jgi:hypothetical protein
MTAVLRVASVAKRARVRAGSSRSPSRSMPGSPFALTGRDAVAGIAHPPEHVLQDHGGVQLAVAVGDDAQPVRGRDRVLTQPKQRRVPREDRDVVERDPRPGDVPVEDACELVSVEGHVVHRTVVVAHDLTGREGRLDEPPPARGSGESRDHAVVLAKPACS